MIRLNSLRPSTIVRSMDDLRIREEAGRRHHRLEHRERLDAVESRHERASLFFEHPGGARADGHDASHPIEHDAAAATEPAAGHRTRSADKRANRSAGWARANEPGRKPARGGDRGSLRGGARVGSGGGGGGGLACGVGGDANELAGACEFQFLALAEGFLLEPDRPAGGVGQTRADLCAERSTNVTAEAVPAIGKACFATRLSTPPIAWPTGDLAI